MADYYATSVCNGFKVNRPDEFEIVLQHYGVYKENDGKRGSDLAYVREGEQFTIYGHDSLSLYDAENDKDLNFYQVIQPFIAEGSIAVFKEVGHTKCMFHETGGYAAVITPTEIHTMSLEQWIEETFEKIADEENK